MSLFSSPPSPPRDICPPPIFCCTYCWFICAGGGVKMFFSLYFNLSISLKWLCLLYNVSVCGWLWRNHGMLYNDATFQSCINLRDSIGIGTWWTFTFPFLNLLFNSNVHFSSHRIRMQCVRDVGPKQERRRKENLRFFLLFGGKLVCLRSLYFVFVSSNSIQPYYLTL
jgi:hypothetical protein